MPGSGSGPGEQSGGGGITSLSMETPTGVVNGVNTEFVFTSPPTQVFLQGVLQNGTDYTLAGTTVTFNVPPNSAVQGLVAS